MSWPTEEDYLTEEQRTQIEDDAGRRALIDTAPIVTANALVRIAVAVEAMLEETKRVNQHLLGEKTQDVDVVVNNTVTEAKWPEPGPEESEEEPPEAGLNSLARGIVMRIHEMKPQLTKKAIVKLIQEERAKAGGILTEEAAGYLVAQNLGVELPHITTDEPSSPVPENLGSEAETIKHYRDVMSELQVNTTEGPLQLGEVMASVRQYGHGQKAGEFRNIEVPYMDEVKISVEEGSVNVKVPYQEGDTGRAIWIALNNLFKNKYRGEWIKDGSKSRWTIPHS